MKKPLVELTDSSPLRRQTPLWAKIALGATGSLLLIGMFASDEPAPQPSTFESAPAPAADSKDRRPAFAMDEVDAQEMLARIDPRWSKPGYQDSSYDGFSGGHSVMLGFDRRSAFIYTRPDGRVWRIRMVEGIAGHCSSVHDPEKLISKMVRSIEPTFAEVTVAPMVHALAEGLSRNGLEEAVIGRTKVASSGGCVDTLTATAL